MSLRPKDRGNNMEYVIASVAWQSQHVYNMRLRSLLRVSEGIFFVPRNDKCNCASRKEEIEK